MPRTVDTPRQGTAVRHASGGRAARPRADSDPDPLRDGDATYVPAHGRCVDGRVRRSMCRRVPFRSACDRRRFARGWRAEGQAASRSRRPGKPSELGHALALLRALANHLVEALVHLVEPAVGLVYSRRPSSSRRCFAWLSRRRTSVRFPAICTVMLASMEATRFEIVSALNYVSRFPVIASRGPSSFAVRSRNWLSYSPV